MTRPVYRDRDSELWTEHNGRMVWLSDSVIRRVAWKFGSCENDEIVARYGPLVPLEAKTMPLSEGVSQAVFDAVQEVLNAAGDLEVTLVVSNAAGQDIYAWKLPITIKNGQEVSIKHVIGDLKVS